MDLKDKSKSPAKEVANDQVSLVVPWAMGRSNVIQSVGRGSRADAEHFISERSRVHETYIREQEKTRRLSLVLAAICFLAGCFVIVFGPTEREFFSNLIGAALLVVSAGAAGYRRVWGRAKDISFGADSGGNQNGT